MSGDPWDFLVGVAFLSQKPNWEHACFKGLIFQAKANHQLGNRYGAILAMHNWEYSLAHWSGSARSLHRQKKETLGRTFVQLGSNSNMEPCLPNCIKLDHEWWLHSNQKLAQRLIVLHTHQINCCHMIICQFVLAAQCTQGFVSSMHSALWSRPMFPCPAFDICALFDYKREGWWIERGSSKTPPSTWIVHSEKQQYR